MTQHPDKHLTMSDLPDRVPGAARYVPSSSPTGGCDVIMYATDGHPSCIDHKPSFQSALRCAIRWQKRENAAVTAENKRRRKNAAA